MRLKRSRSSFTTVFISLKMFQFNRRNRGTIRESSSSSSSSVKLNCILNPLSSCALTPGGSSDPPVLLQDHITQTSSGQEGGVASPAHTCRELRDWRLKEEKRGQVKLRQTCRDRRNQSESTKLNWSDPDWSDPASARVRLDPLGSTRIHLRLKISQLLPEAGSVRRGSRHGEFP